MTRHATRRSRTRGFTLVELMVSIVAGLVAVITIYSLGNGASRHFQEQQRVSQTQSALRLAIEQIRADIERAGFGGSPASRAELRCTPPPNEIQAVEFLDEVSTGLLPFPTVNVVEADGIRLVGNYATSGSYLAVGTNGAGSSISLQQTWQAFRRDFGIPNDTTTPFDQPTFESTFGVGRVLHVESAQGYHFFPTIASTLVTGSTFDIGLATPALPVGSSCLPGLADGAQVTPLSRIEYRVVNPAADADLAALVSTNPAAATLGLNGPVLIRRELPFGSDTPIPGTTRVILEYVADFHLEFVVDKASSATAAPDLVTVTGNAALPYVGSTVTAEPERVRSVIIELSARTASVDNRYIFVSGRASRAEPLLYYLVTKDVQAREWRGSPGNHYPAARVRSVSTEIFLPNVAERNLR